MKEIKAGKNPKVKNDNKALKIKEIRNAITPKKNKKKCRNKQKCQKFEKFKKPTKA